MKAIGTSVFLGSRGGEDPAPRESFRRVTAREANLRESWFRDAIFQNPELVIGPCRAAGRVSPDEIWLAWKVEHNFGSGPIDVLLVSSEGRVGIVETKLSYNPQRRREVVAQILDYALSLQVEHYDDVDWPPLPPDPASPDEADLRECIEAGRFLLIVAGDALDPRAVRLSRAVLGRSMTSEWDLALVDLNLFESAAHPADLLIVPELLGTVAAEVRNVVRVAVGDESGRTRVEVEHVAADIETASRAPRLKSLEEFLHMVDGPAAGATARAIVEKFQQVNIAAPGRFHWGLRSATANLYWKTPDGGHRRIFAFSRRGVFRTWVGYLEKGGYDTEARRVREAAAVLGTIADDEQSMRSFPDSGNLHVHLGAIDAAVEALGE